MSGKITIVSKPPKLEKKKRVAAYARVSNGKDAMLHSLSAQVSYYSNLIQNHGDWLYAGVYSDEAKTGTKDSRAGFQSLISDCRAGKIDMVITKSISRFARNTVTLLQTVREFKAMEVDIYFEEQNIHTMSGDGELMMTILASYAQEESRSASENQKWRIKRNFEAGIPWDGTLLGYRLENGHYVIVPKEAELVRRIYNEYLSGKGYDARFGLAMSIPVILCEVSIRLIWAIRHYFQHKRPLAECIPTDKHDDLRVMLLFGHGTLCLVDGVDAVIRSGGNPLTAFLHINLVGWCRFAMLVLKEICIRVGLSFDLQNQIDAFKRINVALTAYLAELEKIDKQLLLRLQLLLQLRLRFLLLPPLSPLSCYHPHSHNALKRYDYNDTYRQSCQIISYHAITPILGT